MPWKETSKMEERQRFINSVLDGTKPFNSICIDFDISTKTGYKWYNRFKQDGYSGLQDHSKKPLSHPASLSEAIVCDLISYKLAHPGFGPKKIRELYRRLHENNVPSLSSVNRVLKRSGLVKERKRRRVTPNGRLISEIAIKSPNDLWTIDFKGWWMSKDNHRIEPFTVRDDFSRFVLGSKLLENTKTESVKKEFVELFKRYGLPKVIQSDNGSPFASRSNVRGISQLSAWLISLGIHINLSRPGKPQDNGGHERMHRDLKESVQARFRKNAKQYQADLDMWREEFNKIRPHEALDMKTPNEVFIKSNRKYSNELTIIDYPRDYMVRKVMKDGYIRINNFSLLITSALREYYVGLKVVDSHELAVYFCEVFLGIINMKTISFKPMTLEKYEK